MSIGKKYQLYFKTKLFLFIDFCFVLKKYSLKNFPYLLFESLFFLIYLFQNPYRLSRKHLQKANEKNIYQYGETPIKAFVKIAKYLQISKEHTVYELGAGRGKHLFWLAKFVKCKIVAIEKIRFFVNTGKILAKLFNFKNLRFLQKDYHDINLADADIIYLYASAASDEEIYRLIKKFYSLKPHAKILTVSFPLSDYDQNFYTKKRFAILLPWGVADAYLSCKKEQKSCRQSLKN